MATTRLEVLKQGFLHVMLMNGDYANYLVNKLKELARDGGVLFGMDINLMEASTDHVDIQITNGDGFVYRFNLKTKSNNGVEYKVISNIECINNK